VINGRDEGRVAMAAREIAQSTGAVVKAVVGDITDASGRNALLAALPDPDILINNNAGPEPKGFLDIDESEWRKALESNFLAHAFLIKAVIPGMRSRKFGRVVNITSARVKSPTPTMALSTSPRAALTALCKALSFEVAPDNVTLNNLLPERFETERQRFMAVKMSEADHISIDEARARIASTIAAKRMGRPEEFGAACAFLCSEQASYISGQNLQVDGGSYRGLI
jgi:3-oxoacyl-[acyl-carrier protein] reductase